MAAHNHAIERNSSGIVISVSLTNCDCPQDWHSLGGKRLASDAELRNAIANLPLRAKVKHNVVEL